MKKSYVRAAEAIERMWASGQKVTFNAVQAEMGFSSRGNTFRVVQRAIDHGLVRKNRGYLVPANRRNHIHICVICLARIEEEHVDILQLAQEQELAEMEMDLQKPAPKSKLKKLVVEPTQDEIEERRQWLRDQAAARERVQIPIAPPVQKELTVEEELDLLNEQMEDELVQAYFDQLDEPEDSPLIEDSTEEPSVDPIEPADDDEESPEPHQDEDDEYA